MAEAKFGEHLAITNLSADTLDLYQVMRYESLDLNFKVEFRRNTDLSSYWKGLDI